MKSLLTLALLLTCLIGKSQTIKNDTLIVKSPSIKFISIDGKVYEIVRSIELKEVSKKDSTHILNINDFGKFTPTLTVPNYYYTPYYKN